MAVVLVADDDAKLRRAISKTLRALGHSVLEANDGREALRLSLSHKPALVITDVFMPIMDGIETIREIRRAAPGIKIIAMSGGGLGQDQQYLEAAGKLGADLTLGKPFDISKLRTALNVLLE